jgi:glutathione-regulated potassium-efflux system ancillary protein KefG
MSPRLNTEDLIDAQAVAELLGLSHRNTVSGYQRRYPDMPRPVVDLGRGRPKLWLRQEVEAWTRQRRRRRASHP